MSRVTLHAEHLRLAMMFMAGANSPVPKGGGLLTPARHILFERAPAGGLYVIAVDGSAVFIQYDQDGLADDDYVLAGSTVYEALLKNLKGPTIREPMVEIEDKVARVCHSNGNVNNYPIDQLDRAAVFKNFGTSVPTPFSPTWLTIVPSPEQVQEMKPGAPAGLSARVMSVIGRFYDDMREYRDVRLYHGDMVHNGIAFPRIVAMFPWRPQMMLFIAPDSFGDFDLHAAYAELLSATVDPAADL